MALAVFMDRVFQKSAWLRGIIVIPWLLPASWSHFCGCGCSTTASGLSTNILNVLGLPSQPFLGSVRSSYSIHRAHQHLALCRLHLHPDVCGLKTIPQQLYDAASIDGASGLRQFWSVTLPLLRPVLAFVLITHIIGSFQIFDTIAVTTGGGPVKAYAGSVLVYLRVRICALQHGVRHDNCDGAFRRACGCDRDSDAFLPRQQRRPCRF